MGCEASYILWLSECAKYPEKVGGKNASLGRLCSIGIRIPPGFAITTDAYIEFLVKNGIKEKVLKILSQIDQKNLADIGKVSEKLRFIIEDKPIPKDIKEAIKIAYEKLSQMRGIKDVPVSVRSSAVVEDLPGASCAGQHETYLGVRGVEWVLEKIKKCWSSLFTPQAICYRFKLGIPQEKALMSVCVQRMVDAKSAGVMFTLNPLNGDETKIILEGSWGLGEAIVSGVVTPDHWVVDKNTLKILEKVISPTKDIMYVMDMKSGKSVSTEVKPELQDIPSLTDEEVIELARLGRYIEQGYGRAQDIEWAIDRNESFPDNIYILQSRPETVWSTRKNNKARKI